MNLFTCSVSVNPCPLDQQTAVESAIFDPAALGITAEGIAHVFAWGFSSVMFFWFVGYVLSVAIAAIRKA